MEKNETYLTFVQKLDGGVELHRNTEGFLIKKDGETIKLKVKKEIGGEPIGVDLFTHWVESGSYYQVHATQVGVIALNEKLQQEFFEERGRGIPFPWSPPGTFPKDREVV